MKKTIEDYRGIVGDEIIDNIREAASSLSEKHVDHVNATYYGGGVVEILNSLVLLMNDLGIRTGWHLMKAEKAFFDVTKRFHNALQGNDFTLTETKKKIYLEWVEYNSFINDIENADFVVIHDPQPLAMIDYYRKKTGKWFWRCHIDLSNPNEQLWSFLKGYVEKYHKMIISIDKFRQNVNIPQVIIPPSIDPLATKNRELSPELKKKILAKQGIDLDKPLITQVSRFDPWKDPLGVLDAFKKIRQKHNCRLVLIGNLASDDPEGPKIHQEVLKKIATFDKKDKDDIKILLNVEDNDRTINALQTESAIVLQKSTKEGFGLTVSEALWKGTPVIGGNVGGIPLQVIDGVNGYLVNSSDECAKRAIHLLDNPKLIEKMGEAGREHVKKNFLITRHVMDYLKLFNES